MFLTQAPAQRRVHVRSPGVNGAEAGPCGWSQCSRSTFSGEEMRTVMPTVTGDPCPAPHQHPRNRAPGWDKNSHPIRGTEWHILLPWGAVRTEEHGSEGFGDASTYKGQWATVLPKSTAFQVLRASWRGEGWCPVIKSEFPVSFVEGSLCLLTKKIFLADWSCCTNIGYIHISETSLTGL